MRPLAVLCALFLSALPLPSQSGQVVSPGVYAVLEADSSTNCPLGYLTPLSCVQVHDDLQDRPRIFNEIAFRRDGVLTPTYAAFSVTCTLSLSSAVTTSRTVSASFAANHGTDLSVVLGPSLVSFPSTWPAGAPAAFDYKLPFTRFFGFAGQSSLAWEIRVHTTTATASSAFDTPFGTIRGFGSPLGARTCQASDQTSPAYLSYSYIWDHSATVPNTWRHYISATYLAKNQPAVWWIGFGNQTWGAIGLPFSLAAFGRPGCSIEIAPVFGLGGMTSSTGAFNTSGAPVVFPRDPVLTGQPIYDQAFSLDPGSAGLPLVFTDSQVVRVPLVTPPDPASRVFSSTSDTAATGNVQLGVAAVTRFTHM